MRRSLVLALLLLLALLTAGLALAEQRFTDPAGDAGGAPDVTVVNVSDDAAGVLTFAVTTDQAILPADATVEIVFNTDKNPSTGQVGQEFYLSATASGWNFWRWDGGSYVRANPPTASVTYSNGVLTFKVNRSDLGNAGSFLFYVGASRAGAGHDKAPDGSGVYDHTLAAPAPPAPRPLPLRASAPVAVPAKPVAGKAFSVRFNVIRGDMGTAPATGVTTCKVRLGLTALPAVGSFRAGKAGCAMRIPKTARGKRLRGTIKVTFRNVSVTKSFVYRVP